MTLLKNIAMNIVFVPMAIAGFFLLMVFIAFDWATGGFEA